jgi:hypothetical protein
MPGSWSRNIRQKAFIAAAGQAFDAGGVSYAHPGLFSLPEERAVRVAPAQLGRFVDRLSQELSFADYDRLAHQIWVAALRAGEPARGAGGPAQLRREP